MDLLRVLIVTLTPEQVGTSQYWGSPCLQPALLPLDATEQQCYPYSYVHECPDVEMFAQKCANKMHGQTYM